MHPTERLNTIPQGLSSESTHAIIVKSKSALTIGLIAASTFSSMALAYRSPGWWTLTTLSINIITIASIHKLLQNANYKLGRGALAVALIANGSLYVGGTVALTYPSCLNIVANLLIGKIDRSLWHSFILTGLIGYGVPAGKEMIKKGYDFLNNPETIAKLENLAEQLRTFPLSAANSFLQVWRDKLCLILGLFEPNAETSIEWFLRLKASPELLIYLLNQVPSVNAFEAFEKTLTLIQAFAQLYRNHQLQSPIACQRFYPFLKFRLTQLNENDFKKAVNLLQENFTQIVPEMLSPANFTDLLQGKVLENLDNKAQQFATKFTILNQRELSQSITDLMTSLTQLEQDFQTQMPQQQTELKQRLDNANLKFNQIKGDIEELFREKRRWDSLLTLPRPYYTILRNQSVSLHLVTRILQHNPQLIEKLTLYHQEALGLNQNANTGIGGVVNAIRRLTNRFAMAQNDGQAEEPTPAWMFLGTNRCGFVQIDYEDLRTIVKANDLADIETRFDSLGLKTEEDLYTKNILPRLGAITKQQIKDNLKSYIQEQQQTPNIRTRVYQALSNISKSQIQSSLSLLSEKISKLFYRLATMGMILVPVLSYPIFSAIGFGCGLVYFTLKRFRFSLAERAGIVFNYIENHERGIRLAREGIAGRNLLSLTPNSRRNMELFARSDLFARMRILNLELMITMGINYADIGRNNWSDSFGLGGILQGAALSQEVVNLF